jgi:hypothetical protein
MTVRGTAVVNLGACLFFLFLASRVKPQPAGEPKAVSSGSPPDSPLRLPPAILYAVALTSGFYVMMLENVLIRFTNFSIGSSSYAFSLIVAVFLGLVSSEIFMSPPLLAPRHAAVPAGLVGGWQGQARVANAWVRQRRLPVKLAVDASGMA